MLRILVAAALIAALSRSAYAAGASPEARYEAAFKVLSTCEACFDIRDTPEDLNALNDMWSATEDWAVDYLNANPQISEEKLNTALMNVHYNYSLGSAAPNWVTKLGPELFGFGTSYDEIGTAFLVGKSGGRYRVVWDMRNLPARDIERFPILAAWSAERARGSCRSEANEGKWNECGPIHGDFRPLPPDGHGRLRFYLESTYAQAAGETVGAQISIWSWDGRTATPLLARSYFYDFEDVHVGFADGFLTARTKEEYQSYYSCGACLGRRLDWTIRITPDSVTDLGMKPLNPELDTVDALFQAIAKHRSTENLADAYAIAKLAQILKVSIDHYNDPNEPGLDLGMIEYSSVRRENGRAFACVSVDAFIETFDNGLVFTVEKKSGRDVITDVNQGRC